MNEQVVRWIIRNSPINHVNGWLLGMYRKYVRNEIKLVHCSFNGIKFPLIADVSEVHGYLLSMQGYIEPCVSYFFRHLISRESVVLDIGANIGYYTILAGKSCGCNVLSFEPTPSTFSILSQNIEINQLQNISIHQIALSENRGTLAFNIYPDKAFNSVRARQDDDHPFFQNDSVDVVDVPCTTVDQFLIDNQLSHVDVIKLDVEGYEYFVLKGAAELLSNRKAPLLLCEVEPLWLKRFGLTREFLFGYLETFGYEAFAITEYGLLDRQIVVNLNSSDFIFAKECHLSKLREINQEFYSGMRKAKGTLKKSLRPLWRWLQKAI